MMDDSDPNTAPLRPASDIFPAAQYSKAESLPPRRKRIGLDLALAVLIGLALLFDVPVSLFESTFSKELSFPTHSGLKCQNFRIMTGLARQRLASARERGLSLREYQATLAAREHATLEQDPWNTPLRIAYCAQFQDDCVISAGPDRRFETSDDVILPISVSQF